VPAPVSVAGWPILNSAAGPDARGGVTLFFNY
jgi:hypothetical protein